MGDLLLELCKNHTKVLPLQNLIFLAAIIKWTPQNPSEAVIPA